MSHIMGITLCAQLVQKLSQFSKNSIWNCIWTPSIQGIAMNFIWRSRNEKVEPTGGKVEWATTNIYKREESQHVSTTASLLWQTILHKRTGWHGHWVPLEVHAGSVQRTQWTLRILSTRTRTRRVEDMEDDLLEQWRHKCERVTGIHSCQDTTHVTYYTCNILHMWHTTHVTYCTPAHVCLCT